VKVGWAFNSRLGVTGVRRAEVPAQSLILFNFLHFFMIFERQDPPVFQDRGLPSRCPPLLGPSERGNRAPSVGTGGFVFVMRSPLFVFTLQWSFQSRLRVFFLWISLVNAFSPLNLYCRIASIGTFPPPLLSFSFWKFFSRAFAGQF